MQLLDSSTISYAAPQAQNDALSCNLTEPAAACMLSVIGLCSGSSTASAIKCGTVTSVMQEVWAMMVPKETPAQAQARVGAYVAGQLGGNDPDDDDIQVWLHLWTFT